MDSAIATISRRSDQVAGLVDRGARLAGVVCAPGGFRALRTWRPFSISAFRLVQRIGLTCPEFGTILDVGANIGQFATAALGFWPDARLLAFEPLQDSADSLRRRFETNVQVEVHQLLIGDHDGTAVFYPHEYSLSSSALPTLPSLRGRSWAKERPPIEVQVRRLDTLLEGRALIRPSLVKIDVQGFEVAVLDGARRTLDQVDALVLEMAFEPSYEGQPLFPAVHRLLEEAGWSRLRPLDWRIEGGRVAEADFLYMRE